MSAEPLGVQTFLQYINKYKGRKQLAENNTARNTRRFCGSEAEPPFFLLKY